MNIRHLSAAVAAATALTLTACSGNDNTTTPSTAPSSTTSTASSTKDTPMPEDVTRIINALDTLEADHTNPVETDPGISGAKQVFNLNIVDYDAGINLFNTTDDLDDWQTTSDSFGGVSVTFGTTALSLNSEEGKDLSLALAPQIAEQVGGVAHTGGEEPDYTPSGDEASAPVPGVDCPRSVLGDTDRCADPAEAQAEGDATARFWEQHPELLNQPTGGDPSAWDYEGPRTDNGDPADHPQLNWPEG